MRDTITTTIVAINPSGQKLTARYLPEFGGWMAQILSPRGTHVDSINAKTIDLLEDFASEYEMALPLKVQVKMKPRANYCEACKEIHEGRPHSRD